MPLNIIMYVTACLLTIHTWIHSYLCIEHDISWYIFLAHLTFLSATSMVDHWISPRYLCCNMLQLNIARIAKRQYSSTGLRSFLPCHWNQLRSPLRLLPARSGMQTAPSASSVRWHSPAALHAHEDPSCEENSFQISCSFCANGKARWKSDFRATNAVFSQDEAIRARAEPCNCTACKFFLLTSGVKVGKGSQMDQTKHHKTWKATESKWLLNLAAQTLELTAQ